MTAVYDKPISYSGISLWKQCPALWRDQYILGNRQPSGPAAERGTQLHNALEDFFNGKIPYPSGDPTLKKWKDFMLGLRKYSPIAEGECAVTRDWTPCDFNDPNAYIRGKKDLEIPMGDTLLLFDWKSGKIYNDHVHQGEAYTALSPGYERYKIKFVYLDIPHVIQTWEYDRKDWERIQAGLIETVEEIRNATEFPATPGDKCTWCHMSWRRGGDCKRAR